MPSTLLRKQVLTAARRIVVKLGTQLLTGRNGRLDARYFGQMARQVAELRARGVEVSLVSSGAIGAGCSELGLKERPKHLADQQAVAAVGQRRLMTRWHEAFEKVGLNVGQILLTRDDFDSRTRFLNIRNCISRLHEFNSIPIINENDTVAVDELRFGENDLLAALTCNALHADTLILLSVVNGLLDGEGNRVDLVQDLTSAQQHTRAEKSNLGSGGMSSKLMATHLVTQAGEVAVIANGREPRVLTRLLAGEPAIGTVFVPAERKLDSRQRWIALTRRTRGTIKVDAGAAKAVLQGGKSLLAIGITEVSGRFEKGEVLEVCDPDGRPIARGLTNFGADELDQIKGKKSSQFEKILGRTSYSEVMHRDHLVVLGA